MSIFRPLLLVLSALPCLAATFGTVVPHAQPLADLVIDEARRRLYVVNTYSNSVEVYATNVSPPRQTNVIKVSATPLSVALSRTGRYLYVACYDAASLDIIDLNSASFSSVSKSLDAKPQGLAVGFNELVLITTIGTGTGAEVLITYDPLTGRTQPVRGGAPRSRRAHPAAAQRRHVPGGQEPPAGVAGRAGDYRRQHAGGHPHGVRLRRGVLHRAGQPGRARDLAHSRRIARRQPLPQRTLSVRHRHASRPGAAEHHQLALRLPGHGQFQPADHPGRSRIHCPMARACWRRTTSFPPRCPRPPPIPAS